MNVLTTARAETRAVPADDAARSRTGALAALALPMLLASLGTSIANVALPTLTQAFAAPFARVQWVVLAYLGASTALMVVAGRLGDRFGRRSTLVAGLVVFGAASALCALAPTLPLLVAARALQGLGAATLMAMSLAALGESVPPERAGRAMGLLGATSAVGTALGPSLGGALIAWAGWRAVFAALLPPVALALVLALRFLPAPRPAARATADDRDPLGLAALREPALAVGLATSLLVSAVVMATLVVGPFHLRRALGLPVAGVGLVMSVGPLVAALTGVPAGRVVDRFGSRRAVVAGLATIAAGALAIALAPRALGVAGYAAPLAVLTAGYALFQSANNTAVLGAARAERRGVVSGLLNLSRNLGLITGTSLLGAVFTAAVRTGDLSAAAPAAVATGTRTTFVVAALLTVLALVLAVRGLPRAHRSLTPGRRKETP